MRGLRNKGRNLRASFARILVSLKSKKELPNIIDLRPHGMDVGLRLAQLDRNNIDFQVVTPGVGGGLQANDVAGALAIAQVINDGMAKLMEESKGRLIAGGTVPLAGFEQGGSKEMTRAIKSLGLKAITIPSHIKGQPLDTPEFEPFWAQAAELDVPVYIHPSSPAQHRDRIYEGEYDLSHVFGLELETVLMLSRLVFSGIMKRYPTLKVVGHHLGGGLPFWMGRVNETYDVTNPLHDTTAKAIHGLPEVDNEKIFAGNARKMLNLE